MAETPFHDDDVQATLVALWQRLLQLPDAGPGTDFLEHGGDSVRAVQLVTRINRRFGVQLSVRDVFAMRTPAELSALILERVQDRGDVLEQAPAPASAPATTLGHPVTLAQQRLWFLHQLEPAGRHYNLPSGVRLRGHLDEDALRSALAALEARHESLRTAFAVVGGAPHQVVLEPAGVPLVVAHEPTPEGDRDAAAARFLRRCTEEPFDLAAGRLVRAAMLRLAADDAALVITVHHIVTDGWSSSVLWHELAEFYSAGVGGRAPSMQPLRTTMTQLAISQRTPAGVRRVDDALSSWRSVLDGVPRGAELPADRPRPVKPDHEAGHVRCELPADVHGRLRALAVDTGSTTYMVLLAGLSAYLGAVEGTSDVVLGTSFAGRTDADTEALVGFFLNTVPLRVRWDEGASVRDLVAAAADAVLTADSAQAAPFERLVEQLGVARDSARNPLFEILVMAHNWRDQGCDFAGLRVTDVDGMAAAATRFDLEIHLREADAGVIVDVLYATGLYDRPTVERFTDEWMQLLTLIAAAPDARVAELVARDDPAAVASLETPLPAGDVQPVPELVAHWVSATPHAVALREGGSATTYGELGTRIADEVGRLRTHGVQPGEVIAIDGLRGVRLAAAILACMSEDAVFLLLDAKLPAARRAALLELGGAGWLLTAAGLARQHGHALRHRAEHGSPAYVFATSGTTGEPKGVLGTHEGLAHFLTWQRDEFAIEQGDRAGHLTAVGFDVVLRDLLTPLVAGATVCVPPVDLPPSHVLDWLAGEGVTMLHAVPSLAELWQSLGPAVVPTLRLTFFAGEPLRRGLVERWRLSAPGTRIINLYGPTETTLAKLWSEVIEAEDGAQPVGRPLPGVEVFARDNRGLCPPGDAGEVVIRTPHRTLGYLPHRDGFEPNPHRADPADLLYDTGDRGRLRADGRWELLGRVDDQVKVAGVRVTCAEVEAVLATHPSVQRATVVAVTGERTWLAAFVVPAEGAVADELRRHLRETFPDAVLPQVIERTRELPLLPNGKVDRSALRALAVDGAASKVEFVPPRTPDERCVAELWEEMFGLDRVGASDNFFALGGHSLLATEMLFRLHERAGAAPKLAAVFTAQTVAGVAAAIAAARREAATGPQLTAVPRQFTSRDAAEARP